MSCAQSISRRAPVVVLLLTVFALGGGDARASWFLDERKFHISAHGETSCLDCHDDIADLALHPDPSKVTGKRTDFFEAARCMNCHEEISEGLDEGVHGSREVKNPEKYRLCIRCHKPHYQPRLGDDRIGEFDPSLPRDEQCGACHEVRTSLPPLSEEDEACMSCHRAVEPGVPEGAAQIQAFCLHCHADGGSEAQVHTARSVPLLREEDYAKTPHRSMACTTCHPEAGQFYHHAQRPGECGRCHTPHDEKAAHDAHRDVACEACHLTGVKAVKEPGTQRIMWEAEPAPGAALSIHDMVLFEDDDSCRRCHFSGNLLGASSMVLPAKSLLCMPCHASTFSIGDTITVVALLAFVFGLVMFFSVLLSGSLPGQGQVTPLGTLGRVLAGAVTTLFSGKIVVIARAMFFDVLLQRRLYRQSPTRWLIHSLIFLPFVFRFSWGLAALLGSLWNPEGGSLVWAMIYKNHPLTALLFDLTGASILAGVILALIRGALTRPGLPPGLPSQDRIALGLIGGIVVVGFLLESMRIAMTGWPDNAGYAFIGYTISMVFSGAWVTGTYGFVWYLHALLTGAFIAYLPFSRLFHIILGPLMLAIRAVSAQEHQGG